MNVWKALAIVLAIALVGVLASSGSLPFEIRYTGDDSAAAGAEPVATADGVVTTFVPSPAASPAESEADTAPRMATPWRARAPRTPVPNGLARDLFGTREHIEGLIHEEVNEVRAENGLPAIQSSVALTDIARYHSRDMAAIGYFAHTAPDGQTMGDRYDLFDYTCRVRTGSGNEYATGAENIAKTFYQARLTNGEYYDTPEELAEGIVRQWMNSPDHRENILRPFWENEGIGVFVVQEEGEWAIYVTQNFC